MRSLHPPLWSNTRHAFEDDVLPSGIFVPAGSVSVHDLFCLGLELQDDEQECIVWLIFMTSV